jgi:hypothetical protein
VCEAEGATAPCSISLDWMCSNLYMMRDSIGKTTPSASTGIPTHQDRVLHRIIAVYVEQRFWEQKRASSYTPAYCLGLNYAAFPAPPVVLPRSKSDAVFRPMTVNQRASQRQLCPTYSVWAFNMHLEKSNMMCLLPSQPPGFPYSYLPC